MSATSQTRKWLLALMTQRSFRWRANLRGRAFRVASKHSRFSQLWLHQSENGDTDFFMMDDKAYHLQTLSHAAVRAALRRRALIRQPCETCGATAQAHHDSYWPEKWLAVRWLCPTHHREWHQNNEPEWPTIFDFHPCDRPLHGTGKAGRPPSTWYWKARRGWYVVLNGKRHRLGAERDEAETAFRNLLKECGGREVAENPLPNKAKGANL